MALVRWIPTKILVIALGLGLLATGHALTASNVVPSSQAGDGTGTVSGYTVSAIHYMLDTTVPTNVKTVTFTVDSAPVASSTLKVKIGGTWYVCADVTTTVTCDTTVGTQLTVSVATALEAVIAD
jgi:hypothetical protein